MPGPYELIMEESSTISHPFGGHHQQRKATAASYASGENMVSKENKIFPTINSFIDYFVLRDSTISSPKTCNIQKILIATNGIAAVKCITSMRKILQQTFQNDRIIKFICLTTEQEVASQAEYLKLADNIVFSPSGSNTNNYANVDEILEHALRLKVDAVWAGWGHASENPRLPAELNANGITFIGPPADAMFALGDKIASTIIAQTANIPTIEWSGSGIKVEEKNGNENLEVSKELFNRATVTSAEEGLKCLKDKGITYPVMIKASEGGGGKGIRKCISDEEFIINFHRVQAEVPGSPVFLMKCMEHARHIEVQLIADNYGNVIPIYTRDCSIQRRCQKIIEEAPAAIAPPHVLRQMQIDAVNLAKKVGYISAGTVEYMYLPSTQKYYFLELNPRLQVEHPCTEMISNVNIPGVQLQIAMGLPLHKIMDIRLLYGLSRYGEDLINFDDIKVESEQCVIAARITSEDPAEGFRPASGQVKDLVFRSSQNVWGYFSVTNDGKVHEFADSQFGHIFARGSTRHEAISTLLCALKELEIRATFQSQVSYLVGLLRDPVFELNTFHTGWLDERIAAKIQSAPEHALDIKIAVGATVIGQQKMSEMFNKFKSSIERGQILPTTDLTETITLELVHNNVKYSVTVNRCGKNEYMILLNDAKAHTKVHQYNSDGGILVEYADQTFHCYLEEELERYKVTIAHNLTVFEKENDPTILRSRNAGRLLQYLKKDGEKIKVGEYFAEMESMKMVIALDIKKVGGILVQVARPGQILFPGTVIAKLELESNVSTSRPVEFEGGFGKWDRSEESRNSKLRINNHFELLLKSCQDILDGYTVPKEMYKNSTEKLVNEFFAIFNNPKLPFSMYSQILASVKTRIGNSETLKKIEELLSETTEFNAIDLSDTLECYLSSLNPKEIGVERQHFISLQKICDDFTHGLEGHKRIIIQQLLEKYIKTEAYFQDVSYEKGVAGITSNIKDSEECVRMIYSHTKIEYKNALLQSLISKLSDSSISVLQTNLKIISNFYNSENQNLAIFVRNILNRINCSKAAANENDAIKRHLQLERLPNGSIEISTNLSLYSLFKFNDQGIQRFFVRNVITDISEIVKISKYSKQNPFEKLYSKLADIIDGGCGEIRVAAHDLKACDKSLINDCNHLFIFIDNSTKCSTVGWQKVFQDVLLQHEKMFNKLRITQAEIVFQSNDSGKNETFYVIYDNENGAIPSVGFYKSLNGHLQTCGTSSTKFNGKSIENKHELIQHMKIQKKRMLAHKLGTTYCYDLPKVFEKAIFDIWMEFKRTNSKSFEKIVKECLTSEQRESLRLQNFEGFCEMKEMILESEQGPIKVLKNAEIIKKRAEESENDCGMIAWEMKMFTPDSPKGRKIIVIANDITHQMGSFSMKEHRMYYFASKFSRENKLPRVFISANSGARIGLAADIKEKLNVCWNDSTKPEDGFNALCLDESASNSPTILSQIEYTKTSDGKTIIDAIIGKEDDIGVENLVGSGLIAGETSAAYQEVPTYCLVTGRAVGIGAYAARLAHRVVQVQNSHIILTGAPALNSLLGKEIYTSNGQLGGTQIMFHNGVTHSTATTDFEGIYKIVKWMTYLPPTSVNVEADDAERKVTTLPSKGQYDPREILDPAEGGGLFDAGSLDEIMDGWAKTIISARAKLCGQPVGVVAIEPRTISFEIPADPAAADSTTRTVTQAGQVWYPDSAYKTAEAINDFNREGLPLILLANIRGFSGGQKDMFEMVLKFGAGIVDALQGYLQPVIVYIPPYGELRGGAWAVLDTKINPTCITMLADKESRGGVLEPDGIVEIKFRKQHLHDLMMKCDEQLKADKIALDKVVNENEKIELQQRISKRKEFLMPVYRTIAVKFADLHDTTSRMLAKDAIHDQLTWSESRNYIHRLLQVKLAKMEMARLYLKSQGIKNSITINDLEKGCKWVDEHLSSNNISFCQKSSDSSKNYSRFLYNANEIQKYSQSSIFKRVLENSAIQNSSFSLLSTLDSLSDDAQKELAQALLQQLKAKNLLNN
jgi:biotin carboxylase/acetyl-CoA carboxylase carboxyltransferase component/biotin carboxyl carrier protein